MTARDPIAAEAEWDGNRDEFGCLMASLSAPAIKGNCLSRAKELGVKKMTNCSIYYFYVSAKKSKNNCRLVLWGVPQQMLYRSIGILCLPFFLSFCYKASPSTSSKQTSSAPTGSTPALQQPSLSTNGGTYNQPANVTINAAVPNATVCYTISGSVPACDAAQKCLIGSSIPSGWTIQVSSGVLRVLTCAAGFSSSAVISQTYALDQVPPANVSFFTATAGNKLIQLSWSNPSSDFSGVTVVRKLGSTPTSITDGSVVYTGTATSLSQTGLTNGTAYYYAAYSVDAAGNYSPGASANATPFDPPPGNVSVTNFNYASGMVTMTWTNPSDADFAGVRVIRKTGGSPSGPGDGSIVLQGLGTTYTDTYLTNNYTYCYGFYPYDTLGSYATGVVYCAYPGISYPVVWNFSGGNQQVSFSWTASSTSNSAGIRVVRKIGSYPTSIYDGTVVMNQAATPSSSGTFTDTNVSNGTAYYYAAYAYDSYSNYSISYTGNATPRIPAVTSFAATSGNNQVSLSWVNPMAANFQQVKLLRKTTGYPANPSDGTVVYTGTGTSSIDTNLPSGLLHYYVIFVYDTTGVYSNTAYQTGTPTALNNVTSLTSVSDVNQISLSWINPADFNFAGIKIVRKTGSFPTSATDGTTVYTGTGSSFNDTGLPSGVNQYYKIFSTDCCSGYSTGATLSASPSALPEVTSLVATPGAQQVALTWNNPASAGVTGVRVVRKAGSFPVSWGDGTAIYTGTGSGYTDSGLSNDITQYYRVFTSDSYSSYSSGITVSSAANPGNEITSGGWQRQIGTTGFTVTDMKTDSLGNVYVTGYGPNLVSASSGTDWFIKKFDSSGNEDTINWNKRFDIAAGASDQGRGLAIDASNNVYAIAVSISGAYYAWCMKKFSSTGSEDTTNWNKVEYGIYGAPREPRGIAINSNGDVFIAGYAYNLVSGTSGYDWWIRKFSSSGAENITWALKLNSSTDDRALAIAIDSTDNVYIAGFGWQLVSAYSADDWWIRKYNAAGYEITTNWNKVIDGGNNYWDHPNSIAISPTGDVYVSGYWRQNSSGSNSSALIKKYSAAGIEDTSGWNKTWFYPSAAYNVVVDTSSNVYTVGYRSGLVASTTNADWWLKKFTSTGVENLVNWDRKYDFSSGNDWAASTSIDTAGKIYVAGNGNGGAWIKKFNP